MNDRTYTNAAQQRILQVLLALGGHEVNGLAPSQIAGLVETSASNITRDLANLREAGLAEPLESGRWRLTPKLPQIAVRLFNNLESARQRVAEVTQRYTRDPR